ncbi:MAG: hypothetical protein Q9227_000226 [Pyrenula ochraceoflavens]
MPIRARIKKAFKSNHSKSSTPASSDSNGSIYPDHRVRDDVEYYKHGEIPRSKYKGPWNQAHQDMLHAFEFNFSDRPKSVQFSPMGTRAPSRRNSKASKASMSRPSSRAKSHEIERSKSIAQTLEENEEGDDDVANVGLSRQQSPNQRRSSTHPHPIPNGTENEDPLQRSQTVHLQSANDHSFTNELTKALTEVTMKPRKSDD